MTITSRASSPPEQNNSEERRKKRGYNTNHLTPKVHKQLRAYEATNVVMSVLHAIMCLASIIAAAAITIATLKVNWIIGVIFYLLASVFIARQQRSLENMVHDASHFCWHRPNQKLNDMLANLLVAIPTLSTTGRYRKSHFPHHGQYGGSLDPCRRRFAEMGLGRIDLSTRWKIVKAVIRWLPRYNHAYYEEIGTKSWLDLSGWLMWHVAS